jgi:hypothetical protein
VADNFERHHWAMSSGEASYGTGRPVSAHNMTAEARSQLQETYYPGFAAENDPTSTMTLDSLADPPDGTKPRYPYSTLIR